MSLSDAYQLYSAPLENELRTIVNDTIPSIDDYDTMLTYHMGWSDAQGKPIESHNSGKRIRPLLCLMACEAAGGDWQHALPIAAAVEFVHNFSLIHDDIQDHSEVRRGQPTVWRIWGVPLAINAGDALFTVAHLAAERLVERGVAANTTLFALRTLDETSLHLTQGQHLDLQFEQRDQVDIESYLEMIEGKSSALLATAVQLGALIAGAPKQQLEHFRLFGLNLGMAFQVIDDILGIWGHGEQTGKSKETDLQAKKKTLPVLFGLQHSPQLRKLYTGPPPLNSDAIAAATDLLDDVGARAHAEEVAGRYSRQALTHLEAAAPQGQAASWLRELADFLLNRDR